MLSTAKQPVKISLIKALERQDLTLINNLLTDQQLIRLIDFNEKDIDNNTLLQIALEMHLFDIAHTLLNHREIANNINAKNKSDETALDIAAREDKSGKTIEFLLKIGAKAREKSLCNAIQNGNIEGLKQLLMTAKEIPANLFDRAILSGNPEVMELLLAKEKEIATHTNQPTPNHSNHLLDATQQQKTEIIKILLEHEANPNYQRHSDSATPLSLAAEQKNEEITFLLLSHQAFNGICQALIIATRDDNKNLATLLLIYNAIPYDALSLSQHLNNGMPNIIIGHIHERELYEREKTGIVPTLLDLKNNANAFFFSKPVAEIIHSYMKPTIR